MADLQQIEFATSLEDVLRLFGPEGMLYSRDQDVFLRELVQNALDAIEVRRGLAAAAAAAGAATSQSSSSAALPSTPPPSFTIRVAFRPKPWPALVVEDDGWGMEEATVREHLAHPLRGIRRDGQATGAAPAALIGRFGVGLLSAFKVSDRVQVETAREGHPPLSVTLSIRRGPDDALKVNATIGSAPPRPPGTRVTVHFLSTDPAVAERATRVATAGAILDALTHYVRHPAPDVTVLFACEGKPALRVANRALVGADSPLAHRFESPGLRGCLALPSSSAPAGAAGFQACYRGILVKTAYPTLLPEEAAGLTGEIDVTDALLVDVGLSREEFLNNDRLGRLRQVLAAEIGKFNTLLERWNEAPDLDRSSARRTRTATRDGTAGGFELFAQAVRSRFGNLIGRRILQEMEFHELTKERWVSLPDLAGEVARAKPPRVYLAVQPCGVYRVAQLDGRWMQKMDDLWELCRAVATERREPMLLLATPPDAPGSTPDSFAWVERYLRDRRVEPLPARQALDHLEKVRVPGAWPVDAWLAKFPKAAGLKAKAYVVKADRSVRQTPKAEVYVDAAAGPIADLLRSSERLERNPPLKAAVEAWLSTLAWRPDLAEEGLRTACRIAAKSLH
ncbi:MAG: ATP-binding protein [Planctomycetes bacterium]|nr:ATP-binding protein [Planctomycetota bacterium]